MGIGHQGELLEGEVIRGDHLADENDTRSLLAGGSFIPATEDEFKEWQNRNDGTEVVKLPG
jgi:hypothetical protein